MCKNRNKNHTEKSSGVNVGVEKKNVGKVVFLFF